MYVRLTTYTSKPIKKTRKKSINFKRTYDYPQAYPVAQFSIYNKNFNIS